MKITLQKLVLENFKGVKNFTFEPNGKDVGVFGDNETGKTTLNDAFRWLLFNKNSSDEKSFGIKTISIPEADHSVTGVFMVDDTELTLKKCYKENWVKKKGTEEATLQGHETSYWINEVPSKAGEYEAKIKSLIDESVFKSITDVFYFNNLKWQDRRKFLLETAGNVSDLEVIQSNKDLEKLLQAIEKGHSIDEYMKIVKEKKKMLKNEIDKLPTRIDEADKSKPEAPELSKDELVSLAESLKQQISAQSSDVGKVNLTLDKFRSDTKRLIEAKGLLQSEIDLIRRNHNNAKYAAEQAKDTQDGKYKNSIKLKKDDITQSLEAIQLKEKRRDQLKADYKALGELKFDASSTVCPTCKRDYEADKVSEMKSNFNADIIRRAGVVESDFNKVKEEIKKLNESLELKRNALADVEAEYALWLQSPDPAIIAEPNFDSEKAIALKAEIEKLQADVDAFSDGEREKEDTSIVDGLSAQLEEVNRDLQKWTTIETLDKRIEELRGQEKELSKQYAQYEKSEFLTEQFIKTKVGMLQDKINSMFSMIEWKLFNVLINGGVEECCEATVKGVPYQDVNSAGKINAGLDIINCLTKYYGVSCTVFIDNAESVTKYIETDSQTIKLYVSEPDKTLRVEVL